jgi:thymidylate kinase
MYQQRVFEEFERLAVEHRFVVVDGERKVEAISRSIRDIVRALVRQ